MNSTAVEVAESFWKLMMTNDFRSVGSVLSDDFILDWPQSKERIRGRENFAAMNEEYPAQGLWCFTVNKVIGSNNEAVTDVSVTDGVQNARVISFFTIQNGRIAKTVEFWPEPFAPADNRKDLVERLEECS